MAVSSKSGADARATDSRVHDSELANTTTCIRTWWVVKHGDERRASSPVDRDGTCLSQEMCINRDDARALPGRLEAGYESVWISGI